MKQELTGADSPLPSNLKAAHGEILRLRNQLLRLNQKLLAHFVTKNNREKNRQARIASRT